MKPDEHLPRIHCEQQSDHDARTSDGEREDRPSPMDRHYARGRSQVSNKCSSHSSTMGTPTKLPYIDSHSQSVTSIFSLRDTPPTKHKVLPEERRFCRSPSCPNLHLKGRLLNGAGDEEDIRLPVLKVSRRKSMQKDFNRISESHRRLKARATVAAAMAGTARTGSTGVEEAPSPPKNAMLLPLRDNSEQQQQQQQEQQLKAKVSTKSPTASRKKDRKRKTLSPNAEDSPDQDELDLSHSDVKCLIWLAEVKANQSDLKEVT